MSITKTSVFSEMRIQPTKQIYVTMIDTIDDPDDADLPIQSNRVILFNPDNDISSLPTEVQTIINAAWNAF